MKNILMEMDEIGTPASDVFEQSSINEQMLEMKMLAFEKAFEGSIY